ncbi:serine/threonine protein kinase [Coemansia erecta]|uniref:Serine/threonine protein kinase n=1 Tax=Coemansia erecta TaxID=147472 RepID=A0A9W7XXS1_9FUNG|nr:serine/threonine protein kinase [Coemansia erecta]
MRTAQPRIYGFAAAAHVRAGYSDTRAAHLWRRLPFASAALSFAIHMDDLTQPTQPTQFTQPTQKPPQLREGSYAPGAFARLVPRHPHLQPLLMDSARLLGGGYTVGRNLSCDVRVDRSYVSATHCQLYLEPDRDSCRPTLYVVDRSANGTFVNDRLLGRDSCTVLLHKDRLGFVNPSESLPSDVALEYAVEILDAATHLPTAQPSLAPSLLRTYDFKHEVGAGNFAKVWLAIHKQTGTPCACKVIETKKHLFATGLTKVFKREIDIMSQLNHPNIVPLHELHVDKDRMYIFMEYLEAGDLFTHLSDHGPFAESVCRPIFCQISSAIRYLHSNGITHRDIKLDNILIKSSVANGVPWVKIADFGLARAVGDGELMRTICGTPSYLAPEIICRSSSSTPYSKSVDIWALGVMLYALHIKSFPFDAQLQGGNIASVTLESYAQASRLTEDCHEFARLSAPLQDLLTDMLQINPEKRIAIDAAILHPWTQTDDSGSPGPLYAPYDVWGSLHYAFRQDHTSHQTPSTITSNLPIDLFRSCTTIGRSRSCHIQIPDPRVSSAHCEILLVDTNVHIRNLSRNQCWINGNTLRANQTAVLESPYEFALCSPSSGEHSKIQDPDIVKPVSDEQDQRIQYCFRLELCKRPWRQVWATSETSTLAEDSTSLLAAVPDGQANGRISAEISSRVLLEQDPSDKVACGLEYAFPKLPTFSPPLVLPVQAVHLSYLPFRDANHVHVIDGSLLYDPSDEELLAALTSSADGFAAARREPWLVLGVLDSEYPRMYIYSRQATFGRRSDCSIVFSDAHISQLHCILELVNGQAQIANKSMNGVFVNGARAESSALSEGDEIVLLFDRIDPLADSKMWLGQRRIVEKHGYPVLIGYRVVKTGH